jgi:predicted HicB family RNase H-like nuclease
MPSRPLPKYGNSQYNDSELLCAFLRRNLTELTAMAKPQNANKPMPKVRTAAIRVRIKPSVKATAEQLAQKDARSLADWLERLIAAEKARRAGKK